MRWTEAEDDVLFEYGSLGAEQVRRMLVRQCGTVRTVGAVVARASRIGASLMTYEVCPECGKAVKELTRDGFCRTCKVRRMADAMREENERIRKEVSRDDEADIEAVRDYDLWRKRNSLDAKARGERMDV